MENLSFKQATINDIPVIYNLAHRIWRKHYPSMISDQQIDYMLDKMYSQDSLKEQIQNGHVFWLAFADGNALGYLSHCNKGEGNYFLNKFYVDADKHRRGIGKQLFDFVFNGLSDLKSIRLTVNRKNYTAVNYYFKNGFVIEEVADFDIGDGYEMNDFVMLKKVKE